jgi:DNA-binding response OmpR family regulator
MDTTITQRLAGMKILVVEDQFLINEYYRSKLEEAGATVYQATEHGPFEDLLVQRIKFNAAILDVDLNGASSDKLAAELRARGVPFVVVSGLAPERMSGPFAGAPFLRKPVTEWEVIEALEALPPASPYPGPGLSAAYRAAPS